MTIVLLNHLNLLQTSVQFWKAWLRNVLFDFPHNMKNKTYIIFNVYIKYRKYI